MIQHWKFHLVAISLLVLLLQESRAAKPLKKEDDPNQAKKKPEGRALLGLLKSKKSPTNPTNSTMDYSDPVPSTTGEKSPGLLNLQPGSPRNKKSSSKKNNYDGNFESENSQNFKADPAKSLRPPKPRPPPLLNLNLLNSKKQNPSADPAQKGQSETKQNEDTRPPDEHGQGESIDYIYEDESDEVGNMKTVDKTETNRLLKPNAIRISVTSSQRAKLISVAGAPTTEDMIQNAESPSKKKRVSKTQLKSAPLLSLLTAERLTSDKEHNWCGCGGDACETHTRCDQMGYEPICCGNRCKCVKVERFLLQTYWKLLKRLLACNILGCTGLLNTLNCYDVSPSEFNCFTQYHTQHQEIEFKNRYSSPENNQQQQEEGQSYVFSYSSKKISSSSMSGKINGGSAKKSKNNDDNPKLNDDSSGLNSNRNGEMSAINTKGEGKKKSKLHNSEKGADNKKGDHDKDEADNFSEGGERSGRELEDRKGFTLMYQNGRGGWSDVMLDGYEPVQVKTIQFAYVGCRA